LVTHNPSFAGFKFFVEKNSFKFLFISINKFFCNGTHLFYSIFFF
jgi:hypothetical protein